MENEVEKKIVVFGGYIGMDLDAIAQAVARDACSADHISEVRHICKLVIQKLPEGGEDV